MTKEPAIVDDVRKRFNHLCVGPTATIVRVVGYGEDEYDYYWVVKTLHGKIEQWSYVGGFESLKGKIDGYDNMDKVFEINGGTKEPVMLNLSEV